MGYKEMNKLKRCPFCGSRLKIVEVGNEYYPVCTRKLGMCLLKRTPIVGEDGFIYKEDAIELCNTRPLEDELLEALIEIRSQVPEESKRKLPLSHIIAEICDPIIEKHTGKPIDEVIKEWNV